MKEISINDLPQYSTWVKRILAIEDFSKKYKTKEEVLREYENEKWGILLKEVLQLKNVSLKFIESSLEDPKEVLPFYLDNKFFLGTRSEILLSHLNLYKETIGIHLEGASALVELGAGYGSKILNLSTEQEFSELPLYAGEFTKSGCDLISLIASSMGKKISVGYCDFREMEIDNLNIPENSVIFTSYAAHYVPQLSNELVNFFSKLKPKIIINFEPCYEHHSDENLFGLMCKRYIELNDYNTNLSSILERAKSEKKISLKINKNVIGSNPFLPISVIEWSPLTK